MQQLLINLASRNAAHTAHIVVDVTALEDQCGAGDVGVAAVGATANEDLLDGLFLHVLDLFHVVRGVRAGHQGF